MYLLLKAISKHKNKTKQQTPEITLSGKITKSRKIQKPLSPTTKRFHFIVFDCQQTNKLSSINVYMLGNENKSFLIPNTLAQALEVKIFHTVLGSQNRMHLRKLLFLR